MYTYAHPDNRLTQNADGTLTTSTYDAANQLLTAMTNSEITTFSYDANGNQTVENVDGTLTTYTWDAENRMTGAAEGSNTESFTYAGDGQRRKKSTSTGDINYLWDEENILEELDGSNSLIAHYTDFPGYWGGLSSLALPTGSFTQVAGMGTFNAVQFNQATFNQSETTIEVESHFYLFDLQSSNRLLLNADTATDNEYLYKAFGEKVLSTGSIWNPFQFQGMIGPYFDANNRTWMRARIYNPITGRWNSKDPIGFAGRDWNLYRFVRNGAINSVDPSGLFRTEWCYVFCAALLITPGMAEYPACVDGCSAANDVNELRKLMNKLVKRRGICRKPKVYTDCFKCPGTGNIFTRNCYDCCQYIGEQNGWNDNAISNCNAWCDVWGGKKRPPIKEASGPISSHCDEQILV